MVPDKLATAPLANIALVIAPFAIAVAFPTLVTGPVKLAFVVTVAALPETLPTIVEEKVFAPAIVWSPTVYTPLVTVPALPVIVV